MREIDLVTFLSSLVATADDDDDDDAVCVCVCRRRRSWKLFSSALTDGFVSLARNYVGLNCFPTLPGPDAHVHDDRGGRTGGANGPWKEIRRVREKRGFIPRRTCYRWTTDEISFRHITPELDDDSRQMAASTPRRKVPHGGITG